MAAAERPAPVATLRRLLAEADFAAGPVHELLGTSGRLLASMRRLPAYERRLEAAAGPLPTLVRLLVLALPVEAEEAARRLGDHALEALAELRLTAEEDGAVRATARIVPHELVLVASDLVHGGAGPDHVASVHPPSATLAALTVRRPVARALDVGTGNGIQALLLAQHAERVVATDVNERALAFAAFNCALNGVDNVDLRHGSVLEPVEGERFDLVVSNPPYLVSPETDYVFRDSGLRRDEVCERFARELPTALADGGFATLLLSWIPEGDDAAARPRAWTEGSGCDALLLHTGLEDALTTTLEWNRDAAPSELGARLDRWLAYYRDEGIEAVAYGGLVLRRREDGATWFHALDLAPGERRAAGPHLERIFAAQDLLREAGDDELLERPLHLAPAAVLEHRNRVLDGEWKTVEAVLVLDEGLAYRAGLDPAAAAVVTRLGGDRPLREVLAEAAASRDAPVEPFTGAALAFVRRLLELGFAVPARTRL